MFMLNENIRRFRKQRGMTQRELAEKLRISDKTVSRWESGVQIPDAEIVPDLARIFGVSIGELYGEERIVPDNSTDADAVIQVDLTFPPADKHVIRRVWFTVIIAAMLVLSGSLALCLNNFYSMSVYSEGSLLPFGKHTGRTLGIVLFGTGCLCIAVVMTVYMLWYRKPSRENPRYERTAASINLFTIILLCVLMLFILPRFLGFAVTPVYFAVIYAAAFLANALIAVHKRRICRRYSIKSSTVITVISWAIGGLSIAAALICLDLHLIGFMSPPTSMEGGDTAVQVAYLMYDEFLLNSNRWFIGEYYFFLLAISIPLSAMLLLNSIEWKVRADRLNKAHPAELLDRPVTKRITLRVLCIAVALLLLAGSVFAVLSVSGVLLRYETVEVLTDSMSPTLHSGDKVSFCTSADMELLWQWDVILFKLPDGMQMIGRITRVNSDPDNDYRAASYVVQQDNPEAYDKRLVDPQDVIGVWLDAPRPSSSDDEETGIYSSVTDRGISLPQTQ